MIVFHYVHSLSLPWLDAATKCADILFQDGHQQNIEITKLNCTIILMFTTPALKWCVTSNILLTCNIYTINVWFQKISIPPPPHRRSLEIPRGRGVKRQFSYFQGVGGGGGGVHGKLLFQRMTNHEHNSESNVQSIVSTKTYVRCFETKISTPGHWDEVNIISFNVSVFLWVS